MFYTGLIVGIFIGMNLTLLVVGLMLYVIDRKALPIYSNSFEEIICPFCQTPQRKTLAYKKMKLVCKSCEKEFDVCMKKKGGEKVLRWFN